MRAVDHVSYTLNYTQYIHRSRYTSTDVSSNIAVAVFADSTLMAQVFESRLYASTSTDRMNWSVYISPKIDCFTATDKK